MKYPERIVNSKNSWLYKKIWKRIFVRNGQFSLVICGKCGSGKSYLGLEIIHRLVGKDWDVDKFVVFSAEQFASLVAQKLPKGTAILFDDSGLAALSGDALKTEVKYLSKIFQSVRSRNFIIILTLPSLFLLATGVRSQLDYYAEPLFIDYDKKVCHAKFQTMQTNPKFNKTYFANMIRFVKKKSALTGLPIWEKQKLTSIAFDKPPKSITKVYEKVKLARVMEFNREAHSSILEKKKAKKRLSNKEIANKVAKKRDDFMAGGKISHDKIRYEFNVGDSKARSVAKIVEMLYSN